MKYTKSLWPDWDSNSKDAEICLSDEVYIEYDEYFIADGFVNNLFPDVNKIEVTLHYLHNFDDKQRSDKSFRASCLEFERNITRLVSPEQITFIAGEAED